MPLAFAAARLADSRQRLALSAGEIDIIARRWGVLAAIEVKSRPNFATGAAAVLPRQQRRIARALETFLAMRPELALLALRFDVMVVEPRRLPHHLPGAWRSDC